MSVMFFDAPGSEPVHKGLFYQPALLVGKPGLEPGRLSAHDPNSRIQHASMYLTVFFTANIGL